MPLAVRFGVGTAGVVAVAVLGVLSGCAVPPSSSPEPSPTSTPGVSASGVPECPSATVEVETAEELAEAIDTAAPGDVIALSDGRYVGTFAGHAAGSADEPIFLCGGPEAVLDGGGVDEGTVIHLDGTEYWNLIGFTVENGKKGVMVDGGVGNVIGGLVVREIGDEAIHLRAFSTDNTVVGNTISETGMREPEFGEGIYIGTAESNWCEISDCEPDRSNRNQILENTVSDTTAESVDIKEGTSDGVLRDNVFDGSALTADADSWVDVKGNDWLIEGNRGVDSPGDGFQTHEILDGWGSGNRFRSNVAEVNGPGYGFALTPELTNVVECDNEAPGADAGLANVECRSG